MRPYQEDFINAFEKLRPQVAQLVGPTGVGKGVVGAYIADRWSAEGPVLVLSPGGLVTQWADRIRALQRSRGGTELRDVVELRRGGGVRDGEPSAGTVYVAPMESWRRSGLGRLLKGVEFRLIVIDEAHRLAISGESLGDSLYLFTSHANALLLMTATPLPGMFDGIPRFEMSHDEAIGLGRLQPIYLQVEPSTAEKMFMAEVEAWASSSRGWLWAYVRRVAAASPIAAWPLLERIAASAPGEVEIIEDGVSRYAKVGHMGEPALAAAIEAGERLESPDSKSRAALKVAEGISGPVAIVCGLEEDRRVIELTAQTSRAIESVTPDMEVDERLAASDRIRSAGGLLLVSDGALSGPLVANFEAMIYRDAGLSQRALQQRLALASESLGATVGRHIILTWPTEPMDQLRLVP